MFKSYVKIAIRNVVRNKLFSIINISGLSIALTSCLLILLYIKDELSFDRFHDKNERLFRVTCEVIDRKAGRDQIYGESAAVQGPAFKNAIPEIEDFVRVYERKYLVISGNESYEENALWVDKNFFSVFSFPLIYGDPGSIFNDPHSIVLSEDLAKKYYGRINPLGESLQLEVDKKLVLFKIMGIAKRSPENSSIRFDMLIPFNYYAQLSQNDHGYWHLLNYSTFLLLRPHTDPKIVMAKMKSVYEHEAGEQLQEVKDLGMKFSWGLEPILNMHLDAHVDNEGSIKNESKPIYSYMLSGIAILLLLIACINFINISLAQSLKRSKEIGLRKTIGGNRAQLIQQFLGESFTLCLIAYIAAGLLTYALLPIFNVLANKNLKMEWLLDFRLLGIITALFLLTGFLSGFYPALVLSRLDPADTMQNRMQHAGRNYLAKVLVVFQFAISTFLVIATFFIFFQYHFLTHTDLGYNDKNLIAVNVEGQEGNRQLLSLFKTKFKNLPGVENVSEKMNGRWTTGAKVEGRDIGIDYDAIDEDYLPTLEIPLLLGRNFSRDLPSDTTRSAIINETFAQSMGWKDPIGKMVDLVDGKERHLKIVGMVKDFHFVSLKKRIIPNLFTMDAKAGFGRFLIRLKQGNSTQTLKAIEDVYRGLFPFHPFTCYFVREENLRNYETESRWKQILLYAVILTVFISSIGLLGLTLLSIRKRVKEIGVRKVLGANSWQISFLLTKNYIGLVILAFLIAVPLAWYAVGQWFENFPYHIQMNGWILVIACLCISSIAVLTVGLQALKAAHANPVKSLRTE